VGKVPLVRVGEHLGQRWGRTRLLRRPLPGDSSLFGNAELRWWVGRRKNAVLPVRWGLTAFAESGRVWYEGEDSKKWHTGYGGGLMMQLVGTPMALGASIANGTEGIRFYFAGGYSF